VPLIGRILTRGNRRGQQFKTKEINKRTQKFALNRFENEVEVSPKITNLVVLLCEQIDKNSIDPYS